MLAHRRPWLLLCAAAIAFASVQPATAQLRGSLEEADARADSFSDPPEDDPDADIPGARLLPEEEEAILSGEVNDPVEPADSENERLLPSQPNATAPGQRARRAPAVGTPLPDGTTIVRSNVAAPAVQGGGIASDAPGPYDPLGIRLGPLRLTTTIEQSVGVTSNAEFTAGGEGGGFSETRFGLTAVSDLPVHEFRGSLRGAYRKFFDDAEDLPTLDADAAFRYDLRRDTTLTFGANYAVASESATDDSLLGLAREVRERPLVQRGEAFVEAARSGGRIFGRLRGSVGRELYGDIEFTDGTSLNQSDREATLFETSLRLGYRHTPALQPFIEGELGYRLHDEREDRAGQNRDAARYALRAGVQVDLADKLTGSIAAGVESVIYESERFDTLVAPSIAASLDWSPDRLTRVALTADTFFDDSVTAGVGGTLDYRLAASAERDLRDNLALFGTLSLGLRDPGGDREQTTLAGELGLAWSLNRSLALTGRVTYSRVESALANADYNVKAATVGLRWQR